MFMNFMKFHFSEQRDRRAPDINRASARDCRRGTCYVVKPQSSKQQCLFFLLPRSHPLTGIHSVRSLRDQPCGVNEIKR